MQTPGSWRRPRQQCSVCQTACWRSSGRCTTQRKPPCLSQGLSARCVCGRDCCWWWWLVPFALSACVCVTWYVSVVWRGVVWGQICVAFGLKPSWASAMSVIHQDSFLMRLSSLSPHRLSPEAWGTLAKLMDGAIDTYVSHGGPCLGLVWAFLLLGSCFSVV